MVPDPGCLYDIKYWKILADEIKETSQAKTQTKGKTTNGNEKVLSNKPGIFQAKNTYE